MGHQATIMVSKLRFLKRLLCRDLSQNSNGKTELLLIFFCNAYFILSGSFLGTSKKIVPKYTLNMFVCKFYRGHQLTHALGDQTVLKYMMILWDFLL